ncbi:hypothetical protein [Rhodococcus olei]
MADLVAEGLTNQAIAARRSSPHASSTDMRSTS